MARLRRTRRDRGVPRARTEPIKKITREDLRVGALLHPPVDWIERPRTWGECRETNDRPCPWVGCAHHLYLDVNPETGSIKLNFPSLEPWELPWTCDLDEAARGGMTLEQVGERMNVTRERTRQLEVRACIKLAAALRPNNQETP